MTYGIKFNYRDTRVLEHLRYAQVLLYKEKDDCMAEITLWCPRCVARGREATWQEMNIKRLASFGIVAEKVIIK